MSRRRNNNNHRGGGGGRLPLGMMMMVLMIMATFMTLSHASEVDIRGLLSAGTSVESSEAVSAAIAQAMAATDGDSTTTVLSAEEGHELLKEPGVQAALAAKTPDAVDRLIQGILSGTGKGGVVTNEFNRDGVHATIISNVNELRVEQLDNAQEERYKAVKKLEELRAQQANPRHVQL